MVQVLSMGQNSSLPKARRKSLRSFSRKSHGTPLSHTFTFTETEDRVELLNVNQASEEELMTLPGINRGLARNITEHRKAIGRFRKVEDLALVRGLGADKLEGLRGEICVSNRRSGSRASSRAQSYDSLRSSDSRLTVRGNKLVNVNRANVFELQGVQGVTQEVAAAIVHHREKRGPFKQLHDLVKVKGVDRMRLDNISRFLTVDTDESPDPSHPPLLTNGFRPPDRRANGYPARPPHLNGLSSSSLFDIFDLLSAYSPRPIIEEPFSFTRRAEPAARIASWNLQDLTLEKASNPGVREVICRTILENFFSIIAVQDVKDVAALKLICEELNKPRLRRVSEWKDKNHNWNFCMLDLDSSRLGFIYDSDGAVDIEVISLTQGPEDTKDFCEVLAATFKLNDLSLQLVNIKLEKLSEAAVLDEKIRDLVGEEDMLLLFLDFASVPRVDEKWLEIGGLAPTWPPTAGTSLGACAHTANIFYNSRAGGQVTGVNGIVRGGLTHLAIPNGWHWGGPASAYCPVWIEVFLNCNVGTAL